MSLLLESKTRLMSAMLVLATGTYLLTSAAPPQVTPMPKGAIPSGTILPFAGTVVPLGYLLCDGTEVQRQAYPQLFATVGEAFGAATSFTFTLPDLRGRFLRGVDGAANNDPNHNTRTAIAPGGNTGNNPGSVQGDARRGISGTVSGTTSTEGSHSHNINTHQDNYDEDDGNGSLHNAGWTDDSPSSSTVNIKDTDVGGSHNHSINISATFVGDAETRPKNVYVNYIIKL